MKKSNKPKPSIQAKKPIRLENDVLADLKKLCCSSGYIHAAAYLCFRDDIIFYEKRMKEADMTNMFSSSRLIRTEINTLIGLMIQEEIDFTLPSPDSLQKYVNKSDQLLHELHKSLSAEAFSGVKTSDLQDKKINPFESGKALREPIFYGGEAAYHFQYLDFAISKYAKDNEWLMKNRGFTIDQVSHVAKAVEEVQTDNFEKTRDRMRKQNPNDWTMLHMFEFSEAEVAAKAGLDVALAKKVLEAFTLPTTERNTAFKTLHDFNAINATPLLQTPDGKFLSLQVYSLAEAVYEAPFYWIAQDKAYLPTLSKNRGDFTEDFVAERLEIVFGNKNVHQNVDIFENKATRVSDIDILVTWANRLIIVQTKSKRLTLEARKGNDQVIRDDFKKSVQAAYDQAAICAKCLLNKQFKLVTQDGREILLQQGIKEIYLFCVVSDHYPALSFQSKQFLKVEKIDLVQAPLVMDVFAVDAMTEMLQSPLQFLSYINRRANYDEQLLASQELTILGYHLTKNLWVAPDAHLMHLDDSFTAGLDIAMAVRRTGIEGAATPDGVLTRFTSTLLGRIVKEIDARPETATIDLGFMILALSEQAVFEMSNVVDRLALLTRTDAKVHDATFAFKEGFGITFHCNDDSLSKAGLLLESYCELRKYKEKANQWFGLCMSSNGPNVRFGITLTSPWIQDSLMDKNTEGMQKALPIDEAIESTMKRQIHKKKTGRNELCPCGSGIKYKKCCLMNN